MYISDLHEPASGLDALIIPLQ